MPRRQPSNYYNEIDPYAAHWLQNLIREGLIPAGRVDSRSIVDIDPEELRRYSQCHFFAGIGGWAHALALAEWPADRPVWTGSCPCQPFSLAGKRRGVHDERHLWPTWFDLIAECRPPIVFGEQVASAIGKGWLDGVFTDLEGEGYACGAAVLPAASVGAPHRRDRLWFVAHADGKQRGGDGSDARDGCEGGCAEGLVELSGRGGLQHVAHADGELGGWPGDALAGSRGEALSGGPAELGRRGSPLADADGKRQPERQERDGGADAGQPSSFGNDAVGPRLLAHTDSGACGQGCAQRGGGADGGEQRQIAGSGCASEGDVADAGDAGREGRISGRPDPQRQTLDGHARRDGATDFWSDAEWVVGADGKARPAKPGVRLLAHGATGRVGRLRAYGNAIVPQVAAEFIAAVMEC